MADPIEIDVNNIKYVDSAGNEINPDGTKKKGGGIFSGILEAVPNILKSLFPNGIGGGGNNYPTITTLPGGNQAVNMGGSNNMMMIVLILMVGFLIFTMNPVKAKK